MWYKWANKTTPLHSPIQYHDLSLQVCAKPNLFQLWLWSNKWLSVKQSHRCCSPLLLLASPSCRTGSVKWSLPEGVITPLLSNLHHVSHQAWSIFCSFPPTLLGLITHPRYHHVTLDPSSVLLLPPRSKGIVTPFTPAHAHACIPSQSCPSRPWQPGGLSLSVGTVE